MSKLLGCAFETADDVRNAIEFGIRFTLPFIRVYVELTEEQYNGLCPEFINEGTGNLKEEISTYEKDGRYFYLVNATKKVNGKLIGDPDWTDKAIVWEKIKESMDYYGKETILLEEEFQAIQVVVEEI